MNWRVEVLDEDAKATLYAMPTDIIASFVRIMDMIEGYGLERRESYDALEDELALAVELAGALIEARRSKANMTQEQVAAAMGTTQLIIERLESGRTIPSTRTLERFAKATGMRLRVSFEPAKPAPARTKIADAYLGPEHAPVLWKDRKHPYLSEKPIHFILRVYSNEISKGMTQAHLRKIDLALYQAFHRYCLYHEIVPETVLPRSRRYRPKAKAT